MHFQERGDDGRRLCAICVIQGVGDIGDVKAYCGAEDAISEEDGGMVYADPALTQYSDVNNKTLENV